MNPSGRFHSLALTLFGLLLALPFAAPLHAAPESAAATPPTVRGFIVRLKNAPAHEGLRSGRELPRDRERADAVAANESSRWQRVLGEAGLSGSSGQTAPRLRPVGRDQQWLDFGRTLSAAETEQIRERLLRRADVDWVEPSVRERRLQVVPPNDLHFVSGDQWWLGPASGSNASAIDDRRRGVAGFLPAWLRAQFTPVVVAVLDTGITSHPDLDGRVLPGYDFVSDPVYSNDFNGRDNDASDPGDWVADSDGLSGCASEPSSWHGTIVAGMVAAQTNNIEGVAGIHWAANILPVRVAGKCGADPADIIEGMRWAGGLSACKVDDGRGSCIEPAPANPTPARIINISFGGSLACGQAYQDAVNELRAAGAIVVAAAGNEWSAPTRPANCAGVVGVAGLNRDGFKSNYSNFGSELLASGIATVSGDDSDGSADPAFDGAWASVLADSGLVTLTNDGTTSPGPASYARLYGTSFATPQVAGTIALMLSLNPSLTYDQTLQGLKLSARAHVTSLKIGECSAGNPGRCICTTATCGVGILDAEQALIYASSPGSYSRPPGHAQGVNIDHSDIDRALRIASQDRPGNSTVPPPDDNGGGAFGVFWLMALATAAICVAATRRKSARARR